MTSSRVKRYPYIMPDALAASLAASWLDKGEYKIALEYAERIRDPELHQVWIEQVQGEAGPLVTGSDRRGRG